MKKTLVFLVLLAMLLPSGWMDPQSGAAWQSETSSTKSTGTKLAAQEGQALTVPTDIPNPLYPADMDPISTCQAPLGGPFGKDVEIFMGGDVGYRIDMIPEWKVGGVAPVPTSISNISAVAASSENIVAVWKDGTNHIWFDLWQTSGAYPDGDWVGSVDLGFLADGDPTIIAKSEFQYEVYARKGSNIHTTILTDTLGANRATPPPWVQIEGVNNAASDPVVIAVNPNHTVIFYLDAAGRIWFTEWTGGWEWRDKPIPLVDNWRTYLPLAMTPQSGSLGFPRAIIAPSSGSGVLSASQNFQGLNAIARNDNHMAVFAVDTDNQLWVREWTRSSADDWSNTHWVKLMEGVALEKPGITSRHTNNIGVVVRDISGNPFYIDWSNQTGWTVPASLPTPTDSVLSSAFTLVSVGASEYWLFAIDQTGQIRELIWSEDAGWGEWGALDKWVNPDQTLAVPVRHFMDVMVLGRDFTGEITYLHYTSQGGQANSTAMFPQRSSPYLPRGEALAWVNGSDLHIAGRQSDLGPPYFWQVDAREMVDISPLTTTLLLDNHDILNDNVISVAAGDLDYDGNDEAVIATRSADVYGGTNTTMISVLDFGLDTSLVITRVASTEIVTDSLDISLKIGDLDGNGRQDEIVITAADFYIGVYGYVYRYIPETHQLVEIYQGVLLSDPYRDYEVEIAVGRLYSPDPDNADPSQQYLGEQLSVIGTHNSLDTLMSSVNTFTMITGTWDLATVDTFQLANANCSSACSGNRYRSALDAGDLNGDGFDEIAAWHGKTISLINPRSRQIVTDAYEPIHEVNNGQSLSVGDIDLDGRAEILAGSQQYLSIYETMGNGQLVRTKWQQWDPSWGTVTAVLAGDLDHDTFVSKLVGCKTFREARVAVAVNGAPRWYDNGVPIQNSSGSFSLSKGGSSSNETGTSHSWGTSLEIGYEPQFSLPFVGNIGSVRTSIILEYLSTIGESTTRDTELIYGTDYTFDDISLGQIILNVRSYTCNYYDLYPPDELEYTSRAMVCNPIQHEKEFHSLDWWLTSGNQGDFEYSWADVGHKSPGGVHTNSLEEPRNYASSLPFGYRVVYNWSGSDIPLICGDQHPQSVAWWAEDAQGYSEGQEVSVEENTSVSTGLSMGGFNVDRTSSYGNGRSWSETYGWTQKVGFSGGVTQFYDDPTDPGDNRPCYKIVPYVYQARAQTLGGFTYPYLELDYYVVCIGCGG